MLADNDTSRLPGLSRDIRGRWWSWGLQGLQITHAKGCSSDATLVQACSLSCSKNNLQGVQPVSVCLRCCIR